jgi:hydroxymethylglutaryl-CoA reductase
MLLRLPPESHVQIADPRSVAGRAKYHHNIENYIGTAKIPIGLAGPLRINGQYARGNYYIPLATTRAGLVAAYNQSFRLITVAGGCTTTCEEVQRGTPVQHAPTTTETNPSDGEKIHTSSCGSAPGMRATAEVTIPAGLVCKHMRTKSQKLVEHRRRTDLGELLNGTIGLQNRYGEGLMALFLACGQDMTRLAESAEVVNHFEVTKSGELYAAVTLSNLMVCTAGAGTGLPSQRACLEIMGAAGPEDTRALAEICAAVCLGGELLFWRIR